MSVVTAAHELKHAPSHWLKTSLGQLVENGDGCIQTGPFGSQLHAHDYVDEGVPVVMPQQLGDNLIDTEGIARITEEDRDRLSRHIMHEGDIVFSRRGDVTRRAYITANEDGWLCGTGCLLLRLQHPGCDNHYLVKFLGLHGTRSYLTQHAVGATMPNLNQKILASVPVRLPPLAKQERVVQVVSAYDDLIENNRRRIQLLEQAARLLHKEWFVHFRFPGHEHSNFTLPTSNFPKGVPEGWEKKTYSDLFELLGGFAFKSKTYQAEGKYGIVTIKNVHDARFIPECPSRLDDAPEQMKEHCVLKTGDVLLSLTGNVGRACIVYGENYLLNQRVAKIVGKPGIPRSFVYWTFSNETTQKELENFAYGVAQLNLSPIKLGEREFVKPLRRCWSYLRK